MTAAFESPTPRSPRTFRVGSHWYVTRPSADPAEVWPEIRRARKSVNLAWIPVVICLAAVFASGQMPEGGWLPLIVSLIASLVFLLRLHVAYERPRRIGGAQILTSLRDMDAHKTYETIHALNLTSDLYPEAHAALYAAAEHANGAWFWRERSAVHRDAEYLARWELEAAYDAAVMWGRRAAG